MSKKELERREFFRIDDDIVLNYRLATKDEFDNNVGLHINEPTSLTLATELNKMKAASRVHLRHVEKESADIARYFTYLENKIDLVARHVIMAANGLFTESTQPVSISGSGLAFNAKEALKIGSFLELKFVLNPSLTCIHSYAQVVLCDGQDHGEYKIAVEFSKLTDEDRDVLIRHVVKKQMDDIRLNK